jgi:hypothetical protein
MPIILQPDFMEKPLLDKDGKPLSDAERDEYWEDVWSSGVPMSKSAAIWLWEKWGERLGIPDPRKKQS